MGPDTTKDEETDGWITFAKTAKIWLYQCQLLEDLPISDLSGDLLSVVWAASWGIKEEEENVTRPPSDSRKHTVFMYVRFH